MAEKPIIDSKLDRGYWIEHPKYPASNWQYEVANGDTRLGYWEWASAQEGA